MNESIYADTHISIHMYLYIYTDTCIHVYIHIYMHVCAFINTHANLGDAKNAQQPQRIAHGQVLMDLSGSQDARQSAGAPRGGWR